MNQRYLRNIALLLLVWLVSQQTVALVLHGVEHSSVNCHEQVTVTTIDCSSDQTQSEHGTHQSISSTSQMSVCDHCATFCQNSIVTSLSMPSIFEGQSVPTLEPDLSILVSAINVPYRPPIIA